MAGRASATAGTRLTREQKRELSALQAAFYKHYVKTKGLPPSAPVMADLVDGPKLRDLRVSLYPDLESLFRALLEQEGVL